MRILIVTDAWFPQVNGVVRTIETTKRELEKLGHTVEIISPETFRTIPLPTYPEIRIAIASGPALPARIAREEAGVTGLLFVGSDIVTAELARLLGAQEQEAA